MNIELAVTQAIKREIEAEVTKAVEEAKARLQRRIPEIVAGVAIQAMQVVDFNRLGDTLHIKVLIGEKKP